jgi:hypothetical protein
VVDSERREGPDGIRDLGHREYVGGRWEEIGRLQFAFMVRHGLESSHCLLDIACGCLRGGIHFIRYLERGGYLGIDKEPRLIEIGIEEELGRDVYADKAPQFVVSSRFEFDRFSRRPHFAIAQSLFTHLTEADIRLCLGNLRRFVGRDHQLFATFFEGDSSRNAPASHSHVPFQYSRDEMLGFGRGAGWNAVYVGAWDHPWNQMMMKYEADS